MKIIKKKFRFFGIFIILIAVIILVFKVTNLNTEYIVKINLIDKDSPDRILEVYKNNKKIDFNQIKIKDITLCTSDNPAVYYGELISVNELTIILKNGDIVQAELDLEGLGL